jgi:hypothetical protein
MDDTFLMRRFERVGDLTREGQRVLDGNRSHGEAVGQRGSHHQFQNKGTHTVRFLETVDTGDVGVIERREQFGFPLESRQSVGVVRNAVREDLERDIPLQSGVPRLVDFAHPADSEQGEDFVHADPGACNKRHSECRGELYY